MTEFFNTRVTLISKLRQKHDSESWQRFIDQYKPYIFAVVSQTNVPYNDREDLVQNVLLALWERLPDFDYEPEKCKFRSWMKVIIRNCVANYFQKNKRHENDKIRHQKQMLVDDIGLSIISDIEKIADEEWKLYISDLAWKKVECEFKGKVAECFLMFMDGQEVEHICEKLDIKKNTAFVFRLRVQKRLRNEILLLEQELG